MVHQRRAGEVNNCDIYNPAVPFWNTLLEIRVLGPKYGTAVLKGLKELVTYSETQPAIDA